MFDKYRKTLVAGTVAITLGLSASGVMAAGFKPSKLPSTGRAKKALTSAIKWATSH